MKSSLLLKCAPGDTGEKIIQTTIGWSIAMPFAVPGSLSRMRLIVEPMPEFLNGGWNAEYLRAV